MLRPDALASMYLFQPLRRLVSSSLSGVPILMYHSVSDRPPDAKHPYFQTVTSPDVFAEHMKFLQENGFSSINLNEAVAHLKSPRSELARPVVVTFDDGYRDFLTSAFPVLEKHGFTATVFLPTGLVGDSSRSFKGIDCLTWSEVRELHAAGVLFGSHTVTHPQLRSVEWKMVQFEVQSSKQAIEDRLSCAVQSFSYPYAFPEADPAFTHRLYDLLELCGYQNGVSTSIGTSTRRDHKFFLRRLPLNSSDHRRLFNAKVSGGYDWLHTVQYASKLLRLQAS
jgi:peptidoglycan/xylan/chitin deacetylase (PgdA/CDA1 family)